MMKQKSPGRRKEENRIIFSSLRALKLVAATPQSVDYEQRLKKYLDFLKKRDSGSYFRCISVNDINSFYENTSPAAESRSRVSL